MWLTGGKLYLTVGAFLQMSHEDFSLTERTPQCFHVFRCIEEKMCLLKSGEANTISMLEITSVRRPSQWQLWKKVEHSTKDRACT
jgi:hypothetical protein